MPTDFTPPKYPGATVILAPTCRYLIKRITNECSIGSDGHVGGDGSDGGPGSNKCYSFGPMYNGHEATPGAPSMDAGLVSDLWLYCYDCELGNAEFDLENSSTNYDISTFIPYNG